MGPTSHSLALLLLGVGLLLPLGLAVVWWRSQRDRPRGRRLAAATAVLLTVLVAQASVVGSLAVVLNRSLGLYPTWGDVGALADGPAELGALVPDATPETVTAEQRRQIATTGWAPLRTQPRRGDGQYRLYLVGSGAKEHRVIVWVPPGYEKATTFAGLSTVYLYNGAYGTVDWFVGAVRPGDSAGPLVAEKKVAPFVLVAPEINIAAPMDTECTDYPHDGPQAYSWLAKTIPAWAQRTLGLPQDAAHVSAAGWSVGGYCAAKAHAASPALFGAAASLQGFFTVENDATTGALTEDLAADPALRHATDVSWLLANVRRTPPHLLVVTSHADPQSWPPSSAFLAAHPTTPGIWSVQYERAGHAVTAWRGIQPQLWSFLVARTPWPARLARP